MLLCCDCFTEVDGTQNLVSWLLRGERVIFDGVPSQAAKYFATTDERPEPVTITNITGKVPAWFKGTIVRNVQGLYESGQ